MGSFAGAILKTDVERKVAVTQQSEASTEERVEMLKTYRTTLERQRDDIALKISVLRKKRDNTNE